MAPGPRVMGVAGSLGDRADFQNRRMVRRGESGREFKTRIHSEATPVRGPTIVIQPAMEGWREDGKVEFLRKGRAGYADRREDLLHGVERDAMHVCGGELPTSRPWLRSSERARGTRESIVREGGAPRVLVGREAPRFVGRA